MPNTIHNAFNRLKEYCEAEEFKGYDPFDGLNSPFIQSVPFIRSNRLIRLAWIQTLKRAPLNLRPVLRIKKEYNPKALGLFLSGYCLLYKAEGKQEYLDKIIFLSEQIDKLKSKGWSGDCWGYNFDWQARAFFQPRYTPTVVASSFIANALLDAYDITGNKALLNSARSTCDFMLKDLSRTPDNNGNFSFSYSPLDKSVVFNASLLGTRLLSRVYSYTKEEMLKEEAGKSVAFCCAHQKEDGSWSYGLLPFHQWIDNFHTGYNLECIADFIKFTGNNTYQHNVDKGFEYYVNTFFTEEGIPKYYNNSVYPVDIHATAQLIVTLDKLNKLNDYQSLADKVLLWTIDNMQSPKGYFYYQINKHFYSRIPYMRWAQAWMFYALSIYLKPEKK